MACLLTSSTALLSLSLSLSRFLCLSLSPLWSWPVFALTILAGCLPASQAMQILHRTDSAACASTHAPTDGRQTQCGNVIVTLFGLFFLLAASHLHCLVTPKEGRKGRGHQTLALTLL